MKAVTRQAIYETLISCSTLKKQTKKYTSADRVPHDMIFGYRRTTAHAQGEC